MGSDAGKKVESVKVKNLKHTIKSSMEAQGLGHGSNETHKITVYQMDKH